MIDKKKKSSWAGKHGSVAVVVAILSLSVASEALAQVEERFSISLGAFITDWDSEARMDVSGGTATGTPVDFELDLGLDNSSSVFRIDGYYRFNDKHRIDFSAFDLCMFISFQH